MILYVSIFAILVVIGLSVESRRLSFHVSLVVGAALLLFMGTRYETGCDFHAYFYRFLAIDATAPAIESLPATEPGFYLLNLAIKKLGLDYMWANIATSLIYLFCVFRFSRMSMRPMLLVAIFFPILIVQLGMSGVRQALAVGFMLLAYVNFIKKSNLMTAFWVLVAAQFHTSAYIFFPLAWLAGKEISLGRMAAALAVLGPVAAFLLQERLGVYSDRYIEQIYGENSASGAFFRYTVVLIPSVMFLYFNKAMQEAFPNTYPLMRVFALTGVSLLIVAVISTVALHRMIYYVMPVSLLTLVNVSLLMTKTRSAKFHPLVIPVFLLGIYMVGWFSLSRHANSCYVPYDSYLTDNKAMFENSQRHHS